MRKSEGVRKWVVNFPGKAGMVRLIVPRRYSPQKAVRCLDTAKSLKLKKIEAVLSAGQFIHCPDYRDFRALSFVLRLDSTIGLLAKHRCRNKDKVRGVFLSLRNRRDLENLKLAKKAARELRCRRLVIDFNGGLRPDVPFSLNAIPLIRKTAADAGLSVSFKDTETDYFKERGHCGSLARLVLEINNTCNLSCSFCHTGDGARRASAPMTFRFFKKIIDQFLLLPRRVEILGRGEPFLNKDLFAMIGYLKERGCGCVSVSTNGHFLSQGHIRRLIASRLDQLTISLDSLHRQQYLLMRRGGQYEKVMRSLGELSKLRKKNIRRPQVILQFIITRHNETEIPLMRKFARRLGFAIEFRSCSTSDEAIKPLARAFRRDERRSGARLEKVDFCPAPWREMAISCEGKVTFCPKVLNSAAFDRGEPRLILGDLKKTSLENVWNGGRYRKLRRQMLSDKHKLGCPAACPHPQMSLTKKILRERPASEKRSSLVS